MEHYISRLDEIDKWLFDSFGILPGCCCSQENLRHTTARMVAEVLWPKKDFALTWEDMKALDHIMNEVDFLNMQAESVGKELPYPDDEAFYGEILRRFIEKREKI